MGVIDKKEPQTFKKMFKNQSGYYSLMKPLKMSEQLSMKATFRNGDDKIFKVKLVAILKNKLKNTKNIKQVFNMMYVKKVKI